MLETFRWWSWPALKGLLFETYREWDRVEAPRMGAALAFYTMLSIGPLLLLMVSIAGLLFDTNEVQSRVTREIGSLVGEEGGEAVAEILRNATAQKASGVVGVILGIATLLFGASSVALELRNSLNKVFIAKAPEGLGGLVKERSYAVAVVLGAGFLLLVSLIVSAALAAIGGYFNTRIPLPAAFLEILNFVVSLGVFTAVIAVIFKLLPTAGPTWSAVRIGSLVTAILFVVGKTLIGLYIGTAGLGSSYGAAGSLVVLLVWIYYSAQIFFFGAEFTKVLGARASSHHPTAVTA